MQLKFVARLKQCFCSHAWRPCLYSTTPARYCPKCRLVELLSEGEFYARFGRMPQIGAA